MLSWKRRRALSVSRLPSRSLRTSPTPRRASVRPSPTRSSSLLRPCTMRRRGVECRALGAPPAGGNPLGLVRRWRLR
eukprot:9200336-Alexandrium_andersonii.AAC.1